MDADDLPVAARADELPRAGADVRATYRCALAVLVAVLSSLLLGRGYGLDGPLAAGAEPTRRTEGEWVSVPWQFAGARSPQALQVNVDPSACARVVRVEVVETPSTIHVTVWRRHFHSRCAPLSVAVKLRVPLGDRQLVDGGDLSTL